MTGPEKWRWRPVRDGLLVYVTLPNGLFVTVEDAKRTPLIVDSNNRVYDLDGEILGDAQRISGAGS